MALPLMIRPLGRRALGLTLVAALLAGCAVPRPGPTQDEIFEGSVQRQGDAFVVLANDYVTRAVSVAPHLGFSDSFVSAGVLGSDTIAPGDTLGIRIWENVDDGLLAPDTANFTSLTEVQVDGSGFIFVPYAGRIRAAGNSPEAVRRNITRQLEDQTPDPQVEVQRISGDGNTVSVVGAVTTQGVYPIERPTRRLAAMLAQAGGLTVSPELAQVVVLRGGHRGRIWFEDLYETPHFDIALRGGDRILVEEDTRTFTVLGAAEEQSRLPFPSRRMSVIDAVAEAGGLEATSADPTGVFVFRNEPAEIANVVLGRGDLIGPQRLVYVIDLTAPNGMFVARDFAVRDQDTLYITEAPITRWDRTIAALTGSLGAVTAVGTATGAFDDGG